MRKRSASKSSKPVQLRSSRGFALVTGVTMLVLLSVLAIGLLSLAQVSLKSSSINDSKVQAQANARMALMMAIGELQKQLGPDQRISANGAILAHLSPANPHWVGAWNSWKAGESSRGSVDGYSDHRTIQGVSTDHVHPTYTPGRADHFLRWLVSLPDDAAADIESLNTDLASAPLMPDSLTNAVKVVADGSVGTDPARHVAVPLVNVDNPSALVPGRYGWHISDSSQKTMMLHHDNAANQNLSQEIYDLSSPPGTGYEHLNGFSGMTNANQASRIISLPSLDILGGSINESASLAKTYYHDITPRSASVLADVRAGGLKSDLNTLLEREIDVTETGDEFMLYRFDDNNRVPIQDLAAYYQLYDDDPTWTRNRRNGVEFANATDPLSVTVPDAGGDSWRSVDVDRYIKAHNAIYTRPVPIKVHYVMGVSASRLTQEDRDLVADKENADGTTGIKPEDSHRLTIGVFPTVTLWNPTNLPMVMDISQKFRFGTPPIGFRWKVYRDGNLIHTDWYNNLSACIINESYAGSVNPWSPHITLLQLKAPDGSDRIVFEPGEVKLFSMDVAANEQLTFVGEPENIIRRYFDARPTWEPYAFQTTINSAVGNHRRYANQVFKFSTGPTNQHRQLVFRQGDELEIELANEVSGQVRNNRMFLGRDMSRGNEIFGAPFVFEMFNADFERRYEQFRNYQFVSRYGGNWNGGGSRNYAFGGDVMARGMPDGSIRDDEYIRNIRGGLDPQNPLIFPAGNDNLRISADDVIASAGMGEGLGLFEFFLAAGAEVMAADSIAAGGGKKIPSRPFKHSSVIKPPYISETDTSNLYHYGWDWQLRRIQDIESSSVKIDQRTNKSYWGGGYTPENGVTNVIQMRLPVAPPISIASLSHAALGGFSIANQGMVDEANWPYDYSQGRFGVGTTDNRSTAVLDEHPVRRGNGDPLAFRRTTAYGMGGLGPFTFQAVGDSYAHPCIPADEAITTKAFTYRVEVGPVDTPFVDHSYLANKALWDRYFFSSITDQPNRLGVFESANRTAKNVAEEFFIDGIKLPNQRLTPSSLKLTQEDLDALFLEKDQYEDGLADKIARHLMLEGGFNVNSTSVAAWKAILLGLKGERLKALKPQGDNYTIQNEAQVTDTPVGVASLQNEGTFTGSDLQDMNTPEVQWTGYRTLTDQEIEELAVAMVRQVKLRGPFLSMSDFVNRRLDAANPSLAKFGAIQAALDDDNVSINRHFRTQRERTMGGFSGNNVDPSEFAFPQAIATDDAIAYGSNPYVDQSEILQGIGNQLTVRGDTYVIRAYGDALDQKGNVVARAWCEAEVQRIPEYLDPSDAAESSQDDLTSGINRENGRRFIMTRFRWLNPSEV